MRKKVSKIRRNLIRQKKIKSFISHTTNHCMGSLNLNLNLNLTYNTIKQYYIKVLYYSLVLLLHNTVADSLYYSYSLGLLLML